MEIHADLWPGQRLSKKLFWRRGLYVSFSTAGLHPGSWINRLSVSREKFHVTIYVEKARVLRSNLTMFRPCYVWKYYEWFWEVLWLPRKSFIVWFTESVDRQISGMFGWTRVNRIDLVTVFDAILTSRQTREKLQCLYENLMSNNLRKTAVLKNIRTVN